MDALKHLKNKGINGMNNILMKSLAIRMYRYLVSIKEKENISYIEINDIIIYSFRTIKELRKELKDYEIYEKIIPIIYDNPINYIIDCLVRKNIEILTIKNRIIKQKYKKEYHLSEISIDEQKIIQMLYFNELIKNVENKYK